MRLAKTFFPFIFISSFATASPCTKVLTPIEFLRAQVSEVQARDPSKPIVALDVDHTSALYVDSLQDWIVFDGFLEFLEEFAPQVHFVVLSGNTMTRLKQLFSKQRSLARYLPIIGGGETLAPLQMTLSKLYQEDILTGRIPEDTYFLPYIHQVWMQRSPVLVLPEEAPKPPLAFDEWLRFVYTPFIGPNKSLILEEFNGILIDDEFGRAEADLSPWHLKLFREGRGFYAGNGRGTTASTGTDWHKITRWLRAYLAAKR